MWLYYNLPVYKETYDFILLVFKITKNFSREYKYTLWQDMKKEAISIIRYIYRANIHREKQEYLQYILDDLEVMKLEFRLCKDLQLIWLWDYTKIVKTMDSIWKQVSWWKKFSK